jgi:hypothetical protein
VAKPCCARDLDGLIVASHPGEGVGRQAAHLIALGGSDVEVVTLCAATPHPSAWFCSCAACMISWILDIGEARDHDMFDRRRLSSVSSLLHLA